MGRKSQVKYELFLWLRQKNLLWSYSFKEGAEISDRVLIEKILIFGNESQWDSLKSIYSYHEIQEVETKLTARRVLH